jgi:hypothetical protein
MKTRTILIAGAAVIAIPLIAALFRPATYRIERTATIKAPAATIHAQINDMRAMNSWSPFNAKDPNIRGEYKGPPAGPGARYDFAGNSDVGKGTLSIVASQPGKVTFKLDMIEPMEGHNDIDFFLVPKGESTEVTWSMHGPSPYVQKLITLFLDMDKMVGSEFEKGLSTLKARVEKAA